MAQEVRNKFEKGYIWTMYIDGANSKEGVGIEIVVISPKKKTFRFN